LVFFSWSLASILQVKLHTARHFVLAALFYPVDDAAGIDGF